MINTVLLVTLINLLIHCLTGDDTCQAEKAFELPVIFAHDFIHGNKATRHGIARKLRPT